MKFYILLFLNYNLAAFVHRKDARKNIREMEREEIKQAKMAEMIIKGQIDRLKCKLKYYNNVINLYQYSAPKQLDKTNKIDQKQQHFFKNRNG